MIEVTLKYRMAYITLNKKHFFHNLDLIKEQVSDKDKIAIVLKDNAYGHGLLPMAEMAKEYGVLHTVVRSANEARLVTDYFQTILILADTKSVNLPDNAHLAINDIADLQYLSASTKIELKIDSGMHRNGIHIDEIEKAFELIAEKKLSLKGVFTHHRSADVLSSEYFWQEQQFDDIKQSCETLIQKHQLPSIRYHSQNSAATFRTKNAGDIVRVGIAAYGLLEMPANLLEQSFKPVLSLWAEQLHSFKSQKKFKHGYEGKGVIREEKELSTYDIGYADGLLRLEDGISYLLPNGSTLIGRISMDNIIVDATDKTLCIYEDARVYAKTASTISYEVTTRLASHIKRSII